MDFQLKFWGAAMVRIQLKIWLKFFVTLEFDEIWPKSFSLHLVATKITPTVWGSTLRVSCFTLRN
jgi:hypothetical protein